MNKQLTIFIKSFFSYALAVSFFLLFFGIWFTVSLGPAPLALVISAASFIAALMAANSTLDKLDRKHSAEMADMHAQLAHAQKQEKQAKHDEELWRQSLKERASGFPSLFKAINEYREIEDKGISDYLHTKKHPAHKAAEIVREQTTRRRAAERSTKQIQAIIEYYENIAPFLLDFKNELLDEEETEAFRDYTEEEKKDASTHYLTIEEYRDLPAVKRNQMALDRFWGRPKSKRLIGRIYERYIGYRYEQLGYDVAYVGITYGVEDLGRDLICRKGNEIIVVQCKNWSQFKTIFEKHIFQFFGTVFKFKDENPEKEVTGVFITSTTLSALARRFARELDIKLEENQKFVEYPAIKCNISLRDGEKIYHLPFDQQYDKVKIEKHRGEFYCATVKEAEDAGFRRAFRYKGFGNQGR